MRSMALHFERSETLNFRRREHTRGDIAGAFKVDLDAGYGRVGRLADGGKIVHAQKRQLTRDGAVGGAGRGDDLGCDKVADGEDGGTARQRPQPVGEPPCAGVCGFAVMPGE